MKKRDSHRQKSLLRGFVYIGDNPSAIDCIVRDISDAGARLKFAVPLPAIDNVELSIPIKGWKFRGKVMWQKVHEVGVSFVSDFVTDDAKSGDDALSDRVARLENEIDKLMKLVKRLQKASESKREAA